MPKPTFFFYDLETSGLNSADDRIMQFAGQRTTLNLKPIDEPINLLVKLNDDTLPSPGAILTTKITPQSTQLDGIQENELAEFLSREVFRPDTIILGFNSVRFDDKFIQHLFWRNFYDPYEWQWRDGRSRWDMLDVVRMTRALRPEGINWPFTDDKKPTNRLELITKLNGISHESAHDALSDVNALIEVTRLIKDRQEKLFSYLFKMRDKREVKALINLAKPTPFVYTSGRYGSAHNFTTVVYPLFLTKTGNVAVFDLRKNLDELLSKQSSSDDGPTDNPAETAKKPEPDSSPVTKSQPQKSSEPLYKNLLYPTVKELAFNRCPAVAPLGVLDQESGWQKIDLTREQVQKNLDSLKSHPEIIKQLKKEFDSDEYDKKPVDVEASLYDSFVPDADRLRLSAIRTSNASSLADFHPNFADERLPELLLHYKAKNFPSTLSDEETKKWQEYRHARLNRQSPVFLSELKKFKTEAEKTNNEEHLFLLEELSLWYQSLQDADY